MPKDIKSGGADGAAGSAGSANQRHGLFDGLKSNSPKADDRSTVPPQGSVNVAPRETAAPSPKTLGGRTA